ncbi:hypothetical protein LshimejAT787_0804390 [Lyophyllum shimeji]|uniref:Uncharacterized protein n=1 Tax=Lyophyllum shimeji TaxID=47721 RepID=A0A9P3UPE0_LYOSH|nr:hypothetical protein LshimejAT787_0804390 [Lyophyllum shimeji]
MPFAIGLRSNQPHHVAEVCPALQPPTAPSRGCAPSKVSSETREVSSRPALVTRLDYFFGLGMRPKPPRGLCAFEEPGLGRDS